MLPSRLCFRRSAKNACISNFWWCCEKFDTYWRNCWHLAFWTWPSVLSDRLDCSTFPPTPLRAFWRFVNAVADSTSSQPPVTTASRKSWNVSWNSVTKSPQLSASGAGMTSNWEQSLWEPFLEELLGAWLWLVWGFPRPFCILSSVLMSSRLRGWFLWSFGCTLDRPRCFGANFFSLDFRPSVLRADSE